MDSDSEIKKAHHFAVKHGLQNAEQMYPASAICAQLSGELTAAQDELMRFRGILRRTGRHSGCHCELCTLAESIH